MAVASESPPRTARSSRAITGPRAVGAELLPQAPQRAEDVDPRLLIARENCPQKVASCPELTEPKMIRSMKFGLSATALRSSALSFALALATASFDGHLRLAKALLPLGHRVFRPCGLCPGRFGYGLFVGSCGLGPGRNSAARAPSLETWVALSAHRPTHFGRNDRRPNRSQGSTLGYERSPLRGCKSGPRGH